MVNRDVMQRRDLSDYLRKDAVPLQFCRLNIFENIVVNTIPAAVGRTAPRIRSSIGNLKPASYVNDAVVADGHVSDSTSRAGIVLILGTQYHREANLAKPPPGILQNVAFKQHPLRVLQFKIVLDNECMPITSPNKIGAVRLPVQWTKHVVPPDLNIRRRKRGRAAAEDHMFP